jgi:hypothetical protein
VTSASLLWDRNEVPVQISTSFSKNAWVLVVIQSWKLYFSVRRAIIWAALSEIQLKSCIRFVNYTGSGPGVNIIEGEGCNSYVGKRKLADFSLSVDMCACCRLQVGTKSVPRKGLCSTWYRSTRNATRAWFWTWAGSHGSRQICENQL